MKLDDCPLFSRYLGPSLLQRIGRPDWFENRFIQSILRDTGWIQEHEELLVAAGIENIQNSLSIFSDLDGDDPDYDLKVFDALAEVRLLSWARENGYESIEKLRTGVDLMPDYLMRKDASITIAEAKRFRDRDFLAEFVDDRLKGLALSTGCLAEFGLSVSSIDKYERERQNLLRTRRQDEQRYRNVVRAELTEEWMTTLEDKLHSDPGATQEIVCGFFVVHRVDIPHNVGMMLFGPPRVARAAELMLDKLSGDLMQALAQINSYVQGDLAADLPARALVFLSGTGSWSIEWDSMWKALCISRDEHICARAREIHADAGGLALLPFDLIVARHIPESTLTTGETTVRLRYVSFPWPSDTQ